MTMKFIKLRPLLHLLALLLLLNGCAARTPASGTDAEQIPPLLEDSVFVADISRASPVGPRGVTIVAPASGGTAKSVESVYKYAAMLGVTLPSDAVRPGTVPYNAQNDDVRLALLGQALTDTDTRVVWAMRGGYGSSRLLEGLAQLPLPVTPKIFIGYSDMTFVHMFLQKQGWRTIHGSMFSEIGNSAKDSENFLLLGEILAGRTSELRYGGIVPYNQAAKDRKEPVCASITGGNLTCLASAAGTPWFVEAAGRILFLEDVKEPGYKIDRMLTQLKQTGQLDDVEAILLGSFSQGDNNTEYALERFAMAYDKPVFRTSMFGHGRKNYPLVFNAPAVLSRSCDNTFELVIDVDGITELAQ